MQKHKTKHISYGDLEADVDEKISDLILNLWKLDITTVNCCQNNVPKNYVWIEFFSAEDAERFLNLVAEYDDDMGSVYQGIMSSYKNDWKYDVSLEDFGTSPIFDEEGEIMGEEQVGDTTMNFFFSVRFPTKHLAFVKEKIAFIVEMKEENDGEAEQMALPAINKTTNYNIN